MLCSNSMSTFNMFRGFATVPNTKQYECFYRLARVYTLPKPDKWPVNRSNYNFLILKCAENKHYADARSLLSEMSTANISPTVVSYNSFMTGCIKHNRLDIANNLFQEMKSQPAPAKPDVVTYNIMISILAQNNKFEEAMSLLNDMREHPSQKIKPNQRTFFNIVNPLRKVDPEAAFDLVARMKDYSLSPNAFINNAILDTIAKSSSPIRTFDVFKSIRELGYNIDRVSYNIILNLCCKLERDDLLEKYIHLMKEDNISVDDTTLSVVVQRLLVTTDLDKMIALLSGVNTNSKIFQKIVYQLGKQQRWNDFHKVAQFYRIQGVSTSFYNSMITTLGRAGKYEEMNNTFELMKQDGVELTSYTYGSLMTGCLIAKKYERVQELFEEMSEKGLNHSVVTYTILLNSFLSLHNFGRAKNILEEMKHHQLEPSSVTYSILDRYPHIKHFAIDIFRSI